jgi:isoleucyl-tRNA synthetase
MTRYTAISTEFNLPRTERLVLEEWDRRGTFERSLAQRAGAPLYAFDDGPPFATGLPHYGHILTSYIKDVVPRYFTMRGYCVPRRWGWDCHGLPVEFEVEKELSLSGPGEIVAFGLDRFTEACRSLVLRYAAEWERVVTRLGRWVDFERAYRTMDRSYMDSVLWAFHRLHERGLVYEGQKVVPYCCRCQTPLSNFEAKLDDAYRPRTDLSCIVRFRLRDDPTSSLLAWTTTPWTLLSNVALAVHPELDYAECDADEERVWVAADALSRFPRLATPRRVVKGRALAGTLYQPVFPHFADLSRRFVVLAADFVSAADGTGIVHLAPAFGEDDEAVCREAGISGPHPVADNGTFTSEVPELTGTGVFEASPLIVTWLGERGLLFDRSEHQHDYPHCWRCDQPLIYRAVSSWFVRVSALKDSLQTHNQAVHWVPEHIRDGRFGRWLQNARDWAISRNRFWGSPIPVWRCTTCASTLVVGSAAELEVLAGRAVPDLHRPYIDGVQVPCDRCHGTMARVPEVLDCWFESGAMPFAQLHYPFEHDAEFEATFPADFIVEYIAQTRGWFYTLHVLAAALFQQPAFKHAVCHGVLLGTDGRKMSKRLRNYPDPLDVVAEHGSDALRIALLSSPVVRGTDIRFNEEAVRDAARRFIVPLWNAFHYLTTYAALDAFDPSGSVNTSSPLDRYLLHETERLRRSLEAAMDKYDFGEAYDSIEVFIETLSGWYLRLSRAKAWGSGLSPDKLGFYETLHVSLETAARLLAPFMPFVTEALFRALGSPDSVHLADWPEARPDWNDDGLADQMGSVRHVVRIARGIRERFGVRHRHPLSTMYVAGVDAMTMANHEELLRQEVNVKRVELLANPERHVKTILQLNTAVLGKRLKSALKPLQKAAAAGDYVVNANGSVSIQETVLTPGEYSFRHDALDGRAPVAAEGEIVVYLDVARNPGLRLEGDARDLNRAIQDLRKRARLNYEDRIDLSVSGAGVDALLAEHGPWLMEQVLAATLVPNLDTADAEGTAVLSSGDARVLIRRHSG